MKKVFVSIPLKGRSKEQIQDSLDKIKGAAESLLDSEVEILHQDLKDLPDFDKYDIDDSIEFLGEDLKLMVDADYFATIECNWNYRHCYLEEEVFRRYKCVDDHRKEEYNMMKLPISLVAPDMVKKEREEAEKLWKLEFPAKDTEYKELIEERESRD